MLWISIESLSSKIVLCVTFSNEIDNELKLLVEIEQKFFKLRGKQELSRG